MKLQNQIMIHQSDDYFDVVFRMINNENKTEPIFTHIFLRNKNRCVSIHQWEMKNKSEAFTHLHR